MLNNKKILVTGATGFIGSNLVRRLVAENHEVHIFSRQTSNRWRLAGLLNKINDHLVDINDKEKVRLTVQEIKPDIIFHLATFSFFRGIDFSQSEEEIIKTNLFSTMNLINACGSCKYDAFINTGTSSEYGPCLAPMKENQICRPQTAYAVSKCATVKYIYCYVKNNNKPIITIRPFSPFGLFDDIKRMIPEVIINALQNKPITVKNPTAVRDYIYIDDLVDAYLKTAELAGQHQGEVFNVGSGVQHTIKEVAEKIVSIAGSQSIINIDPQPLNLNESPVWQADISKVKQALNWQPKYNFEDGLVKTIDWFKNNLSLYQKNDGK